MNRNQTQKLHHVPEDALFSKGECVPFGITSIKAFTIVEAFFMPKKSTKRRRP